MAYPQEIKIILAKWLHDAAELLSPVGTTAGHNHDIRYFLIGGSRDEMLMYMVL